jgi:hypothetical protein
MMMLIEGYEKNLKYKIEFVASKALPPSFIVAW